MEGTCSQCGVDTARARARLAADDAGLDEWDRELVEGLPMAVVVSGAQALRMARGWARVSQRRLAERAETSQSQVARIESERVDVPVGELRRLLAMCGLTLEMRVRPSGPSRRSAGARRDHQLREIARRTWLERHLRHEVYAAVEPLSQQLRARGVSERERRGAVRAAMGDARARLLQERERLAAAEHRRMQRQAARDADAAERGVRDWWAGRRASLSEATAAALRDAAIARGFVVALGDTAREHRGDHPAGEVPCVAVDSWALGGVVRGTGASESGCGSRVTRGRLGGRRHGPPGGAAFARIGPASHGPTGATLLVVGMRKRARWAEGLARVLHLPPDGLRRTSVGVGMVLAAYRGDGVGAAAEGRFAWRDRRGRRWPAHLVP